MNRRRLLRLMLASFLMAGCTTGESRNHGQPVGPLQSQKDLSLNEAAAWQETVNVLKREMGKREADLAKAKAGQDRLQGALQATEAETARLATTLTERNTALARITAEHHSALARAKADHLRLQAAEAETTRLSTALAERNSEATQQDLLAAKVELVRLASALAEREAALSKAKAEQGRLQAALHAAEQEKAPFANALAEREAALTKAKTEQDRLQTALQAVEKEKALLATATAERETALPKAKAEQGRLQAALHAAEQEKALFANALAEREAALTKAKTEQDRLQTALQAVEKEKALLATATAERETALPKAMTERDHLQAVLQTAQALQAEITKGNIRVQQTHQQSGDHLLIEIAEPLLFDSSPDDRVSVAGIEVLRQIADVLKAMPQKQILIEGHTSNVRIKDKSKAQFSNVVELSKARTLAVLGYLKDFGVDHQNLSASWHLETRPLTLVSKKKDNGGKNHYHFDIIASPKDRSELPVVFGDGAR